MGQLIIQDRTHVENKAPKHVQKAWLYRDVKSVIYVKVRKHGGKT
ncbi:MAG: hypothetical protein ACLUR5_05080 [Eubacterium ventriosum]